MHENKTIAQDNSQIDFGNPSVQLGGCRVTGTDNEQADCAQQAGIWALSTSNNFVGNRVANHYNGGCAGPARGARQRSSAILLLFGQASRGFWGLGRASLF